MQLKFDSLEKEDLSLIKKWHPETGGEGEETTNDKKSETN